jgi:hypothetical protein
MALRREFRENLQVKKSLSLFVASLLTITLSACGVQSQIYSSSKREGVYYSVPKDWNTISEAKLNAYEIKNAKGTAVDRQALVKWQSAFSTDKKTTPSEIFAIGAPEKPLAFARVRSLSIDELNAVSYNVLRDVIVPLSEWVNSPTADTPVYSIESDQEVVEKGARGVRTIFSFTHLGVSQTIDQTAMLSNDHSTMYLFIIRCTSACYAKNKKMMTQISNSFTVRGAK